MAKGAQVVLLTGASRGIGYAAARCFADRGCVVYELSRTHVPNPGVTHIDGDVTDAASVRAALEHVAAQEGRIDIVVCNAGTVISGSVEFTDEDAAKKLMDLNFFGAVCSARAAIPHMRAAGGGRIIFVSSLAGVWPIAFHAYYSVSKAALRAFAFALHNEVRPFGIRVCAVMPGDTNTRPVRTKLHGGDDVYGGRIAASVAIMERGENNGRPPESVGRFICRVAFKRRPGASYAQGIVYNLGLFVDRVLPTRLIRYLVGLFYSK